MTGARRQGATWAARPLSLLPVVDLLVALLAFGVGVLTLVRMAVARTVTTVEGQVAAGEREVLALRASLSRLTGPGSAGERPSTEPDLAPLSPAERELFDRLLRLADDVRGLDARYRALLAETLRTVSSDQRAFWTARAQELCEAGPALPSPPEARSTDMRVWAAELARVLEYRSEVWRIHESCRVEAQEFLPESLLHFSWNKHDQFDMSPQEVKDAKKLIERFVDSHKRQRKIFVRGHCDLSGDPDPNFLLSYQRAQFVANVIIQYLAAQNLVEGRDYLVFREGMGKSRPLPRNDGESEADYGGRLRRIELGFQKIDPRLDLARQ